MGAKRFAGFDLMARNPDVHLDCPPSKAQPG
jgi:hypothetical protein